MHTCAVSGMGSPAAASEVTGHSPHVPSSSARPHSAVCGNVVDISIRCSASAVVIVAGGVRSDGDDACTQ